MREPIQKMFKDVANMRKHLYWMLIAGGVIIGLSIATLILALAGFFR